MLSPASHFPAAHFPELPPSKRTPARPARRRRALRAVAFVAKAVGLTVVFVCAATGGVLLHVGLRAPREFARHRLNDLLATTFKGKIILHGVESVSLAGIEGVDAELLDPHGARALYVSDVRAKFHTLRLVRSLFTDRLEVGVYDVRVGAAEIALVERDGELGIATAFAPAEPSDPEETSEGSVRVDVEGAHIDRAWVHGAIADLDPLDLDLEAVDGQVRVSPDGDVTVEIDRARLEARSIAGVSARGDLAGRLGLPHDDRLFDAALRLDATAGGAAVHVDAALLDREVDGTVVVDAPSLEGFRHLLPDSLSLRGPARVRVEAHGPLSRLSLEATARSGAATADIVGLVQVPDDASTWRATARVSLAGVDLADLVKDGPRSDLAATVEARTSFCDDGTITGTYALDVRESQVAGQIVPAARLDGSFTERTLTARGLVRERGAPTWIDATIAPAPGGDTPRVVSFGLASTIPDLRRVERAGRVGAGSVSVTARGRLDLETNDLVAAADARVRGLAAGGVSLAGASVRLDARGRIDAPNFTGNVSGGGLSAGGYRFDRVALGVRGALSKFDVDAKLDGEGGGPSVTARATVALTERGAVHLTGARADIARGQTTVTAQVPSATIDGGAVVVRGATVEGLGEPIHVEGDIRGGVARVRIDAPNVDLTRVKDLLGREEDVLGHVSFLLDGTLGPNGGDAHLQLDAVAFKYGTFVPATAHANITLRGKHIEGTVDLDVPRIGSAKVTIDGVDLPGQLDDARTWSQATGRMDVRGDVDLGELSASLPEDRRKMGQATGSLAVYGTVTRSKGEALPTILFQAVTEGLSIVGPEQRDTMVEGTLAAGAPPVRIDGLDVALGASLDGKTGNVDLKARVSDGRGEVAFVDVKATPPIVGLLRGTASTRELATMPIEAHAEVAPMDVDRLPAVSGALPLVGRVALVADYRGTVESPGFAVHVEGTGLRARRSRDCDDGLDVVVDATYDGARGELGVVARRGAAEVLDAEATVLVDVKALGGDAPMAWDASTKVRLDAFPLDALDGLTALRFGGTITGDVTLDGLHRDAELEAHLTGSDIEVNRGKVPNATLDATVRGGEIVANTKLTQPDGSLELTATGFVDWGAELAPALDTRRAFELALVSNNFRVDAFAPLLEDVVPDLDGRLDADAKFHVREGGKDGDVDGALTIRQGVFDVPQIGERFHDVTAKIEMQPWGTIRLEEFSARAPTGKVTGEGQMVVKGFALDHAKLDLRIAKGESIPITVEGVPFGRARGKISLGATSSEDGKRLDVAVAIPELQVDLPQSIGHGVQALEPHDDVRIGFHDHGQFVAVALSEPKVRETSPDETQVVATIDLGPEVQIKRDATLDVTIQGQAKIEVDGETRVTGQIRVTRGKLELEGRMFEIDKGQVTFAGGDPSNPYIQATAHWDSPAKTRVFAEFSGTPSSGKLVLRSEPALSQDEILSLVLTGTADGRIGASAPPGQEGAPGVQAVGLAGGVVTEGLNKIISGFTHSVSTRIDSSDANNPQPQIVVQITKNVSASLGYKLGVPAPGDNPDRAELTIDWRFVKNWSLAAAVGDQGSTALDIEWRYSY